MKCNTNFENRLAFDSVADTYDMARPTYPMALFHDLVTICNLRSGVDVLEIGAGSGQATVDLAKLDFNVIAIEPGAKLAELARRKFADRPNVCIVKSFLKTGIRTVKSLMQSFRPMHSIGLDPKSPIANRMRF